MSGSALTNATFTAGTDSIASNTPVAKRFTVARILRRYTPRFARNASLRCYSHRRAWRVLSLVPQCRRGTLGGHSLRCQACQTLDVKLNSCGDRHCPVCNAPSRHQWRERVVGWAMQCDYLHVVFTLPHELNDLIFVNQKEMYPLLFQSVTETLKAVTREVYGCDCGMVQVLHTWGQKVNYHVHMHVVMTVGGLSDDGSQWVKIDAEDEAMQREALAARFKQIYLKRLKSHLRLGKLDWPSANLQFVQPMPRMPTRTLDSRSKKLVNKIAAKDWVVSVQAPPPKYQGAEAVLHYLSSYVVGSPIGNNRILNDDGTHVRYRYKDYRTGKVAEEKVTGEEFVRRFCLHVLPYGLARVRYQGLFRPQGRTARLQQCQALLTNASITEPDEPEQSELHEANESDTNLSISSNTEIPAIAHVTTPVVPIALPPITMPCKHCQQQMAFERRIQPGLFNRLQMHAYQVLQILLTGTTKSLQDLIQTELSDGAHRAWRYSGHRGPLLPAEIEVIETLVTGHFAAYQALHQNASANQSASGIPPPAAVPSGAANAAP